MKKRKIALLLAASLLACSLVACGKKNEKETQEETTETTEFDYDSYIEELEDAQYRITYSDVKVNDIYGTNYVQTIIEVENTGTENMMMTDISYELEDTEGRLIELEQTAFCYPDVIAPNERGYIFDSRMINIPADTELVAVPKINAKIMGDSVLYEGSDVNILDLGYGDVEVTGRFTNNTNNTGCGVNVAVVFFDADGIPLGLAYTFINDDVKPNDTVSFKASTLGQPQEYTDRLCFYYVYAYPSYEK